MKLLSRYCTDKENLGYSKVLLVIPRDHFLSNISAVNLNIIFTTFLTMINANFHQRIFFNISKSCNAKDYYITTENILPIYNWAEEDDWVIEFDFVYRETCDIFTFLHETKYNQCIRTIENILRFRSSSNIKQKRLCDLYFNITGEDKNNFLGKRTKIPEELSSKQLFYKSLSLLKNSIYENKL